MNTDRREAATNHEQKASARISRFAVVGLCLAALAAAGTVMPGVVADATLPSPVAASSTQQAATVDRVVSRNNLAYFADATAKSHLLVNFTPTDAYAVSAGQPFTWPPVTTSFEDGHISQLALQAGEHPTSGPASFFKSRTTTTNGTPNAFGIYASDHLPGSLDFAFTGILTVTNMSNHEVTQYPVVLGQGRQWDGSHNWWIGGMDTTVGSWAKKGGLLYTPDGKYVIGEFHGGGPSLAGAPGISIGGDDTFAIADASSIG